MPEGFVFPKWARFVHFKENFRRRIVALLCAGYQKCRKFSGCPHIRSSRFTGDWWAVKDGAPLKLLNRTLIAVNVLDVRSFSPWMFVKMPLVFPLSVCLRTCSLRLIIHPNTKFPFNFLPPSKLLLEQVTLFVENIDVVATGNLTFLNFE